MMVNRSIFRKFKELHKDTLMSIGQSTSNQVPGWAGYKAHVPSGQPMTYVGAFPLLLKVAHEWSNILTVILQAMQLKSLVVVGDAHRTVIIFDMALYEKAVQLLDAKPESKQRCHG